MKSRIFLLLILITFCITLIYTQEPKPLWSKPDVWYDSNGEILVTISDGIKMITDPVSGSPISPNSQLPYLLRTNPYNHHIKFINQSRPVNYALFGGFLNDLIKANHDVDVKDVIHLFSSPDNNIYGLLGIKGLIFKDARTGKTLGEIDINNKKPWGIKDSENLSFVIVSSQYVLASNINKFVLHNIITGEKKTLPIKGNIQRYSIFTRPQNFYVADDNTLYSFNAQTGDLQWKTNQIPLASGPLEVKDISVLYESIDGLIICIGKQNMNHKLVDTKITILDQKTGQVKNQPFPSNLYVESEQSRITGEPFARVTDCGDGRYFIDSINMCLIDTNQNKEIYYGNKYFKDSTEIIDWELSQNYLARKNFPKLILTGNTLAFFNQDGKFFAYDIITRKYLQKVNLGAQLITVRNISSNYWLVGGDYSHLALTIIDQTSYAEQKTAIKPIMASAWDVSDSGVIYGVDSTLSWVKADLSQGTINLEKTLGKKTIQLVSHAKDGKSVWVVTEDTISKIDIDTGAPTVSIKWKASSLKFDKPDDINSMILWDRGNSLFISRSAKGAEKTVPLQAYSLVNSQLVWTTQVVPTTFAFLDQPKVLVVSRPNGIDALPYPASE